MRGYAPIRNPPARYPYPQRLDVEVRELEERKVSKIPIVLGMMLFLSIAANALTFALYLDSKEAISGLQLQKNTLTKENKDLQNRINSLNEEITYLQSQIQVLQAQVQEQDNTDYEALIVQYRQKIEELQNLIVKLYSQLEQGGG